MKKLLSIVLLLCLCVSNLVACGNSSEEKKSTGENAKPKENVEFTLAFSTWVGSGPFFIAQKKGLYEKYGITPKISIMEDESQYAAALGSNSIQALGHVIDREVISYASGIDEKCVMAYDQSSGGDGIVASADIKSIKDLAGKTVALNKASTSYFFFLSVIKTAGLTEKDLTIKDMDADSAGTSFVEGKVDAAVTWEPWLTNAGQRQGGHTLASSKDYPNTIVDVVTFNQQFIDKNPEAVKSFVKAWNEAVEWYKANPDEGNKIIAEGLSIDEKDVESQIKGVTFYDKETMNKFFDKSADSNIYDVANRAGTFWSDLKVTDSKVDADKFITDKYLDK